MPKTEILNTLLGSRAVTLGSSQFTGHLSTQLGPFEILVSYRPYFAWLQHVETIQEAIGIYKFDTLNEQHPVLEQGIMDNLIYVNVMQFGEGIVEIGERAFWNQQGTNVELRLPRSLRAIGEFAFENSMTSIGEISFPDGGDTISLGGNCFSGANSNSNVILPHSEINLPSAVDTNGNGLNIYINADAVINASANSLQNCTLHYNGNDPAAPWGAANWIHE